MLHAAHARHAGVDYGTRRIGLAVSDPEGKIASPLGQIAASRSFEKNASGVVAALADFDVDRWVVGLPLNMDGSEGTQAKISRTFADALSKLSGCEVHLWDERLSSAQADIHMAGSGLTRKKKKLRRDMLAAQVILQGFLDQGDVPINEEDYE